MYGEDFALTAFKRLVLPVLCLIAAFLVFQYFEGDPFVKLGLGKKALPGLCEETRIPYINDYDLENGELYILSDGTSTVQVFDLDGNYLRGYLIPSSGSMSICAEDDLLYVYDHRGSYVTVMNADGTVRKQYALASGFWAERVKEIGDASCGIQNILGFGKVFDLQTGEVIFRIPYAQSIPHFLSCMALFAAVIWLVIRIIPICAVYGRMRRGQYTDS